MAGEVAARPRLSGVESARGVAAVLVVLYHASSQVAGSMGATVLGGLPRFGHAGVDFFFVLSGFIITYVHHGDIGHPERFAHYAQRRLTRVFPFYWAVLLYVLVTIGIFHGSSFPSAGSILANVVLLRGNIVSVAWTLVFEVTFYALFATLIIDRALGIIVFAIWCGLIIAGFYGHWIVPLEGPVLHAGYAYCLEFLFGILAASILLRHRMPLSGAILVVGALGFLAFGLAEVRGLMAPFGPAARFAYGGCATLIVFGLVEKERSGTLKVPRLLATLGRASYAIYLAQWVAMGAFSHFLGRFLYPDTHLSLLVWAMLSATGVSFGVCASRWLEQPLIRYFRNHLAPPMRRATSRKGSTDAPVSTRAGSCDGRSVESGVGLIGCLERIRRPVHRKHAALRLSPVKGIRDVRR